MASIQINGIPQETYRFILKMQAEIKIKRRMGQYSQAKTVLNIIEDYKSMRESQTALSALNFKK